MEIACFKAMQAVGLSAAEAQRALSSLAEAARKCELPPLPVVARMRMERLRRTYSIGRFLMPQWWRWLWISRNA